MKTDVVKHRRVVCYLLLFEKHATQICNFKLKFDQIFQGYKKIQEMIILEGRFSAVVCEACYANLLF